MANYTRKTRLDDLWFTVRIRTFLDAAKVTTVDEFLRLATHDVLNTKGTGETVANEIALRQKLMRYELGEMGNGAAEPAPLIETLAEDDPRLERLRRLEYAMREIRDAMLDVEKARGMLRTGEETYAARLKEAMALLGPAPSGITRATPTQLDLLALGRPALD